MDDPPMRWFGTSESNDSSKHSSIFLTSSSKKLLPGGHSLVKKELVWVSQKKSHLCSQSYNPLIVGTLPQIQFRSTFSFLLVHFQSTSCPILVHFRFTFCPILVGFWSDSGQILARFWSDSGPILDPILASMSNENNGGDLKIVKILSI